MLSRAVVLLSFVVCVLSLDLALEHTLESGAPKDQTGRIDCMSRRGFGECRSLGLDCVETVVTQDGNQAIQIQFPMLMHKVYFPCSQPFARTPLVMTTIEGQDNNKLYASSMRNVTEEYFTVNVQRVDDVDEPDMHCSDYKICYIAIVV
eukprot:c3100_g1_i1.p1 GENE.c3100_g1_i1~~c3100_g1_i1.p1  ORF type:complete len:149 (-),score=27.02 c3100_g1_i1:11-457(-)